MKLNKKTLLILVFIMGLLMIGCGSKDPAPESGVALKNGVNTEVSKTPRFMNIATATQAGTYYAMGNAFSVLLNKYIDGTQFTAEATAGAAQNIEFLRKKEADLILSLNISTLPAYNGEEEYEGKPYEELRHVVFVGDWVLHFLARKDANINSLEDLRGKKVSVGAIGAGGEATARRVLAAAGIDYVERKDFRPSYIGIGETTELLRNGQIDAALYTGPPPASSAIDSMSTGDIVLVSYAEDEEFVKKVGEMYPGLIGAVVPAGTYPNQGKDVYKIATASHLYTDTDVSEEMVYKITKTIMENLEELYGLYSNFDNLTRETTQRGIVVPLHPGAKKYYEEAGIKTEEVK